MLDKSTAFSEKMGPHCEGVLSSSEPSACRLKLVELNNTSHSAVVDSAVRCYS